MGFLEGIRLNFRGLQMAFKSPALLFWGLLRFAVLVALTVVCAALIFVYHQEILNIVWSKPQSYWIAWLWYVLGWALAIFLAAAAAVGSYLTAQILFSVLITEHMSRLTERRITGRIIEPRRISWLRLFLYLVKQEIPRTVFPLAAAVLLWFLGWLTPAGPLVALISSAAALIFLAWDNTDLVPARRMVPFRGRLRILFKNLPFHLGFGLPFLVPGLNILLLSFAPVGGTLYHVQGKTEAAHRFTG
jgi:CysZ protein